MTHPAYPTPWTYQDNGCETCDNETLVEIVDAKGRVVVGSIFRDKAEIICDAVNAQQVKA